MKVEVKSSEVFNISGLELTLLKFEENLPLGGWNSVYVDGEKLNVPSESSPRLDMLTVAGSYELTGKTIELK